MALRLGAESGRDNAWTRPHGPAAQPHDWEKTVRTSATAQRKTSGRQRLSRVRGGWATPSTWPAGTRLLRETIQRWVPRR
jgi:hypothetical protein